MRKMWTVLLLSLSLTSACWAQLAGNTSIVGNVVDATGAAVEGTQVTALNQGTQELLTTSTTTAGSYEFQFLKAGSYTVTVKKAGFSTISSKDILLSANQTVRSDFSLQVGSVDSKIEVTADIVLKPAFFTVTV